MGTFTGSKMQKSNHYRLYHTVLIGWNEQLSLLLEPCTTSLGVLIKYGFMIKIVASISSKIFAWTKHLTFFDSDTLVIFHWICRLQRCFWTQMFKEGKLNRCENDEALCMSNDANDTLTYYTHWCKIRFFFRNSNFCVGLFEQIYKGENKLENCSRMIRRTFSRARNDLGTLQHFVFMNII